MEVIKMKKLLVVLSALTATLLLGLSITANAAKPIPIEEQTATSGVLFYNAFYCALINVSDRAIDATITAYPLNVAGGSSVSPNAVSATVASGAYLLGGHGSTWGLTNADFVYCEIEWVGQPDDIRATFCSAAHCLEVR
jgi:hypothetical protein